MLDYMADTGIFRSRREVKDALEGVAAVMRSWLAAYADSRPCRTEAVLRVQGAFSISIGWTEYADRYPPWLSVRIRVSRDVAKRLHRSRVEAFKVWARQHPDSAARLKGKSRRSRCDVFAQNAPQAVDDLTTSSQTEGVTRISVEPGQV